MSGFSVTLPSGRVWIPKFVQAIDQNKCIGCGRCFKVCGRDVLAMIGLDEEGLPVEEGEDYEKQVMAIVHPENCVGCEACAKICPKKCYTHAPA
ncbi:MAG: ferredoxin III, nif-specific [Methylohalobius sp.]|nr:ferredoxin III, nif-specific [Methylohalobius sp.]